MRAAAKGAAPTMNPELKRGMSEAHQHFDALCARWPCAFPASDRDVRPLASGAAAIVAAEMGWQEAYARGVLRIWKARSAYCRACLIYPGRIALDGSPTGEVVDDEARAMARELLELRKRRREAERQATTGAREARRGPSSATPSASASRVRSLAPGAPKPNRRRRRLRRDEAQGAALSVRCGTDSAMTPSRAWP
jgi:sRNA-binding protein